MARNQTVQIGNVAEYDFELEFSSDIPGDEASVFQDFCDAYSAVAAFFTTDPHLVVLPREVEDERWWDAVQEPLDWRRLRRHIVKGESRSLCAAIARDVTVLAEIEAADFVVPWGETVPFRDLGNRYPGKFNLSRDASVVRQGDSKAEIDRVFRQAGERTRGPVRVPQTHVCTDDAEIICALSAFGEKGRAAVIKTCHGSGGWGTVVVAPELLASRTACARALAGVRVTEESFTASPLVVQELVPASSAVTPDLTVDAEIAADGRVKLTGMATMLMRGTRYSGCIVSADGRPRSAPWSHLADYTIAVGELLAELGYRGWYDVDFLRSAPGALYALEVNTRRSGPSIAYTVLQRLRDLGGGFGAVAAAEVIRLPRRVTPFEAFEAFDQTRRSFPHLVVIPTTFMGTDSVRPSIGVAVAAATDVSASQGLAEVADLLVGRVGSE